MLLLSSVQHFQEFWQLFYTNLQLHKQSSITVFYTEYIIMVLKVLFAAISYHLCYEDFIFFLAHDFVWID